MVLPHFLYLFQTLPIMITEQQLHVWQRKCLNFIWNNKKPRVQAKTLYRKTIDGGIGMPNLPYYYAAAQLSQLLKWGKVGSNSSWIEIEQQQVSPNVLEAILWQTKSQRNPLLYNHLTIGTSLKIWDKWRKYISPGTSPLTWFPQHQLFQGKLSPGHYSAWIRTGLKRFLDLYQHKKLLSIDKLQQMAGDMKLPWLEYLQIQEIMRRNDLVKLQVTRSLTEFEIILYNPETMVGGTISKIYNILLREIQETKTPYMKRWEKLLKLDVAIEDWQTIFLNVSNASLCVNIKENFFKLLSFWYLTPSKMRNIYKNDQWLCWKGCSEVGTYFHIWWSCVKMQTFWKMIHVSIQKIVGCELNFGPLTMLLGYINDGQGIYSHRKLIQNLLAAARLVITQQWKNPEPPSEQSWIQKVWDLIIIDNLSQKVRTQQGRQKENTFLEDWWPIITFLEEKPLNWKKPDKYKTLFLY